jgi:hypothetical protein
MMRDFKALRGDPRTTSTTQASRRAATKLLVQFRDIDAIYARRRSKA